MVNPLDVWAGDLIRKYQGTVILPPNIFSKLETKIKGFHGWCMTHQFGEMAATVVAGKYLEAYFEGLVDARSIPSP